MIGIYKIENKKNSKVYIGSSKNIRSRWNRHKSELKNNTHWNENLQKEYSLYGIENFTYSIILECKKECLQCNENFLIDAYNSTDEKYGYNIIKNNSKLPEKTKRKISIKTIEALKNPDIKKKMCENSQKMMTPERKKKLSEIMKKKMQDETFKKMMVARSIKARIEKGIKRTEEQKEKTRGSNNGMAKLKENDVLNIRIRKKLGEKRKDVYQYYKELITERGFKAI